MNRIHEYSGALERPYIGASYLLPMSNVLDLVQVLHHLKGTKKPIRKFFADSEILNHDDWTQVSVIINGGLN